jgi:hypothetical protein
MNMKFFKVFLKYMGTMVGAEAGAKFFDKLESEPRKMDRLRNTAYNIANQLSEKRLN